MADIENPQLKKIKEESDDFSFLDLSIGKKNQEITNSTKEQTIEKQIQTIETKSKELKSSIQGTNNQQTSNSSQSEKIATPVNYSESEIQAELDRIKNQESKIGFIKDYASKLKTIIGEGLSINKPSSSVNWPYIIGGLLIFGLFVGGTIYFMGNDDENVKDSKHNASILKKGDNPTVDGFKSKGVISESNLTKYQDKGNETIKLGDILGIGVNYYYLKTNKTLLEKDLIEFDVMNLHNNKICKSHVEYVTKAKEAATKYKDIGIEYKDKIEDNKKLVKLNEGINKFYIDTKDFVACLNNNNLKAKFEEFKSNKPDISSLKNILSSVKSKNVTIDELKKDINQLEKLTNEFFGYDGTNLGAQDNKLLNSLGVEINDGEMGELIKQGSTLPVNVIKEYWTKFPNQKVMQFDIFQGEDKIARNNTKIGKLTITGLKPLPEIGKRVKLDLQIDK
ncbi:MAG: Hsp70 family protein, partial [Candidatus Absconditabacteria bacterium]